MITDYRNIVDKLDQYRTGKVKEGKKLGVPPLDEYYRLKTGDFNVWLGHANTGKTTLVIYLMLLHSIKHETRWLVYSSENEPYSHLRKLVEFMAQKPINKVSEEEYRQHTDFIGDYFKFVDNKKLYTFRDLIKLCSAVKNAWDYQGLMIDPYNSLIKDIELMKSLGGHEYDYQACTEFRVFAKSKGVTINLIAHANTQALRIVHKSDHEYAGYPIPPLAADVEGGGKWVNKSDNFYVVHRYVQHPSEFMYAHLHCRKVKEIETGGRPTPMDSPVKFRAVINNVGFSLNDENLIGAIKGQG